MNNDNLLLMSDLKFNTLLFVGLILLIPFFNYVIKSEHNKSKLKRADKAIHTSNKASMRYYGDSMDSNMQRMIATIIVAAAAILWLLS